MTDVTRILSAIERGDPAAAEQLLPLVYDELRQLAAQKLAQEKPGQTLQATALVHEAYLRLVDTDQVQAWNSRGHFFVAAEAMRRILVEYVRCKGRWKHGGGRQRHVIPRRRLPKPTCVRAATIPKPRRTGEKEDEASDPIPQRGGGHHRGGCPLPFPVVGGASA